MKGPAVTEEMHYYLYTPSLICLWVSEMTTTHEVLS